MTSRKPPRRRARTTLDAATGEVHDRLIRAEERRPAEVPLQALTEADRERAGLDESSRAKRNEARRKVQANRRNWVKKRKIP